MHNVRHSGGIEKERRSSMSNYKENAEFIKNFLDGMIGIMRCRIMGAWQPSAEE